MIKKIFYILCFSLVLQISAANAGTEGSEELSKSENSADECFEGVSRAMFKFNHGLDKIIFKPVARDILHKANGSLPSPIEVVSTSPPPPALTNLETSAIDHSIS